MFCSCRNIEPHRPTAVRKIHASWKALRQLQLEIVTFNSTQKFITFGAKLVLIGAVTLSGFSAVTFFHTSLFLGLCNTVIAIQDLLVFSFAYDNGFSIPRSLQKLKRLLIFKVNQTDSEFESFSRKSICRGIRSIGTVAVKVGNFHVLQRTSTPLFVDFCIKNVLRLVIVHRKQDS